MSFVHLHNHSCYSLLDGACKLESMVQTAKELGMPAIALTDHGVMHGVIDFYKLCKKNDIKPLIGCEVYVAPRSRFEKDGGREDKSYHLLLLAKNMQGYKNLIKLVSLAWLEGFYYKPRIDTELIEKYHEGLIATSACMAGEIPRHLMRGEKEKAVERALWYKGIFGKDNFYIELQNQGISEQRKLNMELADVAAKTSIPLVAANDIHYVKKEHSKMHDILLCLQTGKILSDEERMKFPTEEFYLKSHEEMKLALGEYPEALENTLKIAEACNLEFDFNEIHMPDFSVPEGYTTDSYFEYLCAEGLKERYPNPTSEVLERLKFESDMLKKMGYVEYFLIVWDFINYSKNNGIYVGPGRGSAAGSIVSYLLGITDIDPLKYDLLFERFLNPERVSMPDIDIDFCYERRGEVIDYVLKKYGADKVSQIITFGTMAARGAIRDVGRVLNIPLQIVDRIAKMVPTELGITLSRALEINPEIKKEMEADPQIKEMIKMAMELEGMPRHAGTHAAGVVISKESLDTYLPLQTTSEGFVTTQFAKENVEEIGLLKMDFLGLRTLTVINKAVEMIKKNRNIEIDFSKVDLEDEETYKLLSRGETLGVFQLESSGLRAIIKDLQPEHFEDIIALVALYRPGPLGSGMVEDFIKRKHKEKKVEYLHPVLEPVLNNTYGVIIYQEQVMRIASEMAGFSLGEADLLRRAMGKKKKDIIDGLKKQFTEGAKKKNISEEISGKVFELIEYFAGYGFNKSHSAAYALISFQTAYLKTHYPHEYMAALLSSIMDSQDKVNFYISEATRMGIKVLPPDINQSGETFEAVGNQIVFGLVAVKNVGKNAIEAIHRARKEEGAFTSIQDFTSRVDLSSVNRRTIESLIKAGAFSSINSNRAQLLQMLDPCYSHGQSVQKDLNSSQVSLFEIGEDAGFDIKNIVIDTPDTDDFSDKEKLALEKEYLGFYVSGHPLDEYRNTIKKRVKYQISDLPNLKDRMRTRIAGIITKAERKPTKKGQTMAYCTLEDLSGEVEVLVFPNTLEKYYDLVKADSYVMIDGSLQLQDDGVKFFAEKISELNKEKDDILILEFKKNPSENGIYKDLQGLFLKYKGDTQVILRFPDLKKEMKLPRNNWVNVNSELLSELAKYKDFLEYKKE